ncbi:MAG: TIM barrel protein [Gemmatimonadota bacterium]
MISLGHHCHDLDCLEEVIVGNGLSRGEFYNLPAEDIPSLKKRIEHHSLDWSIHAPLVRLDWYPQPPTWSFLCDVDADNRALTMKMIDLTASHAQEHGAEYIVVHFPSPASDESGESDEKLESIARRSCDRLAELSVKKSVPIHFEGVGQSRLINAEFLTAVLKEFTPLRYCFDTAHGNLAAIYNDFDLYEFLSAVLPYVGSMHLWNTRGREDYLAFRHVPVHPSQSPEDGWVDIARVLQAVDTGGDSLPVIFENQPSYPESLGGYDYREGVKWVKGLLGTSS